MEVDENPSALYVGHLCDNLRLFAEVWNRPIPNSVNIRKEMPVSFRHIAYDVVLGGVLGVENRVEIQYGFVRLLFLPPDTSYSLS